MKNINLRKRIITFILANSFILMPISNSYAGKHYNITWEDESIYEDWYLYNSKCKYLDKIWEYLNNYPVLIDIIKNSNYQLIFIQKEGLLEEFLNDLYNNKAHYIGACVSGYNVVYCESFKRNNIVEKYKDKASNKSYFKGLKDDDLSFLITIGILFHEIGHIYDSKYKSLTSIEIENTRLSKCDNFKEIFNKEKDNFKNTYYFIVNNGSVKENINNYHEYFASSFASYILYPDNLLENCPETYYYMESIIKDMESKKTK